MKTAKITNVRKTGQFPSDFGGDDGNLHSQEVVLSDGTTGSANTKTPVPWYKIGDEVSYEITGEYNGTPKLKISKVGGFQGGGRPKYDSTGQTVGMAINNAVQLVCHGKIGFKALENTARRIVEIAKLLDKEFSPAPPAQTPAPEQKPSQAELPDNMEPVQPAQEPAQETEIEDDDVPF